MRFFLRLPRKYPAASFCVIGNQLSSFAALCCWSLQPVTGLLRLTPLTRNDAFFPVQVSEAFGFDAVDFPVLVPTAYNEPSSLNRVDSQ